MRAHPHFNPFNIFGEIETPDWSKIFPNKNPLVLEIGFSNARWLIPYAKANPDLNVVGLEVRKKFVDKVKETIKKEELPNAYVLLANANTALEKLFKPESISTTLILFPDPWYKDRHLKRRVINPKFLPILHKAMQKDGILHIATDQEQLAKDMREIINSSDLFGNLFDKNNWAPENISGFFSDIELYHIQHGHPIFRLQYKRK
ncbi:tRNA (guanosine(46)-N7)-methyltransferase TrmB [Candidatus Margulisiibacteriota bacterium]